MPKSKRSKVVSLTQTDKKTKELKESLFTKIRESVDNFDYVSSLQLDMLIPRFGFSASRICGIRT
jgi:mRNA turnover protein 4